MFTNFKNMFCFAMLGLTFIASTAQAGFTPFVIRNNGMTAPVITPRNDVVPGAIEFGISLSGQKAAWGSDDINGATIGDILNLGVTRHDDTTVYAPGSGSATGPYLNIWITNGMGQYAVLANEPSNPSFQPLFVDNMDGTKSYSLSYADLAPEPVKVYETLNGGTNNTWVHAAVGKTGMNMTFADIAGLVIEAPSAAYITGPNNVGTGAPRVLGTNVAFGVNWVFGDTSSNYISGGDGYIVSSPSAAAVPEPASIALLGLAGLVGLVAYRRRG